PGGAAVGHLTMIPGRLGLLWGGRRRFVPRVDTGEIAGYSAPSRDRARLWLRVAPRIGEHAFVKLFAHGAQDRNAGPLLDRDLDKLFESLGAECASRGAALHYA